jgi:hypothetical protein
MGGGVFITVSGGKLLNNYIENNQAKYLGWAVGGGIMAAAPVGQIPWVVVRGNRINYNQAESTGDAGEGGGICCYYNLIMTDNQVCYNNAYGTLGGLGGGIALAGAFGEIEINISNNVITHNEATTDAGTSAYATLGGGLCMHHFIKGNIKNNLITFNNLDAPGTYWSWGPGAFIQDITSNSFVFENNRVNENHAITTQSCRGGGVSLLRSGGKYQNNVIQNNSASHGGGMCIVTSNEVGDTAILINNTITDNEATFGGGIYAMSSKSVIVNSIIWGNVATTGPSINQTGSTLEVRYSDIQGDAVWPGEGNLNCNPTFIADGYHLDPACQLVNAGIVSIEINGTWYECPPYDIDGDVRPYANTQPEIGVDEVDFATFIRPISNENLSMVVYPNPADKDVTISVSDDAAIDEVIIYNQTGQIAYRGMPENNSLVVSALQPGIYVIEVRSDQQKFREKLILE